MNRGGRTFVRSNCSRKGSGFSASERVPRRVGDRAEICVAQTEGGRKGGGLSVGQARGSRRRTEKEGEPLCLCLCLCLCPAINLSSRRFERRVSFQPLRCLSVSVPPIADLYAAEIYCRAPSIRTSSQGHPKRRQAADGGTKRAVIVGGETFRGRAGRWRVTRLRDGETKVPKRITGKDEAGFR